MRNTVLSTLVLLLLGTVPASADPGELQDRDALCDAIEFRVAGAGYDVVSVVVIDNDEAWVLLQDSRTGEFLAGLLDPGAGDQADPGSLQGKGNPPGGKGNPGGPNPNGGNPGGGNPPGGKGNPGGPNPNGGNPGGGNPPGGNPGY